MADFSLILFVTCSNSTKKTASQHGISTKRCKKSQAAIVVF
jgi:hypothetical protein